MGSGGVQLRICCPQSAHTAAADPLPALAAHSHMQRYASEGARVLAMAYKQLPDSMTPSELRHLPRGEAESGLRFAGKQAGGRAGGCWPSGNTFVGKQS